MHPFSLVSETRKVFAFLPHVLRWRCLLLAVLGAFLAATEMGVAFAVSLFGAALTSPEQLLENSIVKQLFSFIPHLRNENLGETVLLPCALTVLALSVIVKNLCATIFLWQQHLLGGMASREIGSQLMRSLLAKPYMWHLNSNSSKLQTLMSWRIQFGNYIIALSTLLANLTIATLLLGGALIYSPAISCVVFVFTGGFSFLLYKVTKDRIINESRSLAALQKELDKVSLCSFQGIKEIVIYSLQDSFRSIYDNYGLSYARGNARINTLQAAPPYFVESIGMLMLVAASIILAKIDPNNFVVSLSFVAAVAWRVLPTANKILSAVTGLNGYRGYLDSIFHNIAPLSSEEKTSLPEKISFTKHISLQGVSFTYSGAVKESIMGITLTIRKGAMVGFIGHSGAGKSTLINILTGLLSPTEGTIFVDDLALESLQGTGWAKNIGYVPQTCYLADGTLAQNIAFIDWGKGIDYQRVEQCCQMASIDFLDLLPDGLDTPIGERGMKLSGGQAQRIAIARALYHSPEILILDEATSALDSQTETAIQETVLSLKHKITVVLIAHRLSTVSACDEVFWLKDGAIVKRGSPDTVLPLYSRE